MAEDETKPKRVLSPEARQRIADAQKKRWAAVKAGKKTSAKPAKKAAKKKARVAKRVKRTVTLDIPTAYNALNGVQESVTLAAQLDEAKKRIDNLNTALDKAENAVDDLKAILEREYQYHSLRAEELESDLERYEIEVDN